MIVKVCGIKYQDNADALAASGVDMIGLNFYEHSPRYINSPISIPNGMQTVGVFVNETLSDVIEKIKEYNLDYVQCHGNESIEYCESLKPYAKVIKAVSVQDSINTKSIDSLDMLLFDTKTKDYGGSGRKFDWSLIDSYKGDTPFLLAGGIGPDDAEEIAKIKHPKLLGVDINSQFEIEPGLKDISKIKKFISEIKAV